MLSLAWLIHRAVERPVAPILKARLSEAVANVLATGGRMPAPAGPAVMEGPLAGSGDGETPREFVVARNGTGNGINNGHGRGGPQ